jgi:hypothetical protein
MPAIEEDSDSGNGGVSADGFGARLPRCGLAAAPPLDPGRSRPARPAPAPRRVAGAPAGVAPCALWPLTCGVVATGGAVVVVVVGAGVVSVVVAGGVAVVVVAGGDGEVGVEAAGTSVALVAVSPLAEDPPSAASAPIGVSSASVSAAATGSRTIGVRGLIAQLPRR